MYIQALCTQSEIKHHADSEEFILDSADHIIGFDVKCNVCNTLKGPYNLSKIYAAINDDSEDEQVNFILISRRYVHTYVHLYLFTGKFVHSRIKMSGVTSYAVYPFL